ncbi:MAG TPA: CHAP domain-containing protein [Streptomyces sp.]
MTAQSMLAAARKDLGLHGRPNKITKEYAGRHGTDFLAAAWCDQSITYWARHSGTADAVLPGGDRAYTVWHAQDFQRADRWFAGTTANITAHAEPGDIVFFDWDGTDSISRIDHVGVVERNLGDGRVQTIEANTGPAAGGAVMRRVRAAGVIAGFGRPDYEGEDMPSAKDVADAVYERFTHEVTKDVWAAREGILDVGQTIDPRTAFRQTWAYGKDGYHQTRAILERLEAQDKAIKTLTEAVQALAAGRQAAE